MKQTTNRLSLSRPLYNLTALVLALSLPTGALGRDLLKVVPDTMDMVVGVADAKSLTEKLGTSPTGEIFTNEELIEFFRPLHEKGLNALKTMWPEETNDEFLKEFQSLFNGQALLMLSDFQAMHPGRFALIAEFTGDEEDVRRLISPISDETNPPENATVETYTETVAGVTLHIEEVSSEGLVLRKNGWALIDGVFLLAHPYELLQELAIRQTEEEPANPLIKSPVALEAWEELRGADLYLYANVGEFVRSWEAMILAENERHPNPMFDPSLMFKKLKLESLGVMFAGIRFGKDIDVLTTGLNYEQGRGGITEVFAYEKGDLIRPEFIEANCLSASVSLYDFSRVYYMLREALAAAPMMAVLLDNAFQTLDTQLGFKVEEALIDSLGTEWITYSRFRSSNQADAAEARPVDQVFMFALKDPERFERVLESILAMYALNVHLEERNFLGYKLRELTRAIDPIDPDARTSYLLTEEYLIVNMGSTQLLEHILSGKAENSLWEDPSIVTQINLMPPNPSELNYINLGAFVVDTLRNIAEVMAFTQPNAENMDLNIESLSRDLKVPVISIGATYITNKGLMTETRFIRSNEEAE